MSGYLLRVFWPHVYKYLALTGLQDITTTTTTTTTTTDMPLRKKSSPFDIDTASPSVESKKKEQLVGTISRLDRTTYLDIIQADEEKEPDLPAPPPAYLDVVHYTPSTTSDVPAGSNMISISQTNKSIKGTWVIDTRLAIPSSLASSSSSGSANYNLFLSTKNGTIAADVALVSGGSDRATMFLHGYNGSIKFNLVCMRLTPYSLDRVCLIHVSPPCRSAV